MSDLLIDASSTALRETDRRVIELSRVTSNTAKTDSKDRFPLPIQQLKRQALLRAYRQSHKLYWTTDSFMIFSHRVQLAPV